MLKPKKDAYLDSTEVARWLGHSMWTITDLAEPWRDSGGVEGIPAFKSGRAWRFDSDRIQQWLDEKQKPLVPRCG